MKKLSLILVTLAVTMLASVPVFAGPLEEVAAARAEQEKRLADYVAYQERLAEFQAGEIAKGQAMLEAGRKAEAENFARIAAFQASEIAKGKAAAEAGRAAEAANFARIAAFQQSQLAIQAAREAERAEARKAIDAYLALF